MIVTNRSGISINYEAAVNLMDDELREQIHRDLAPDTEQEFFAAYEEAHLKKYGSEWELSKSNPAW